MNDIYRRGLSFKKTIPSLKHEPKTGSSHSPNRHERLWSFQTKCQEIDQTTAIDPVKGAALFSLYKRQFFSEDWTTQHFRSFESKELLIQLNSYFRRHRELPTRPESKTPNPKPLDSKRRLLHYIEKCSQIEEVIRVEPVKGTELFHRYQTEFFQERWSPHRLRDSESRRLLKKLNRYFTDLDAPKKDTTQPSRWVKHAILLLLGLLLVLYILIFFYTKGPTPIDQMPINLK